MRRAVLVLAAACHAGPAPVAGTPDDLAAYLRTVDGADEATRRAAIAGWMLDEASWRQTLVEPYRALWQAYALRYAKASEPLVAQLAARGAISARRHYAGDQALTHAEARLRWTLPVQYPSVVAELDGAPIDAVFVYDGAQWRAIVGLDPIILERVRALDPACEAKLERAGPTGRCTEVAWLIEDAALRDQAARFAHACQLAATLCGNASP